MKKLFISLVFLLAISFSSLAYAVPGIEITHPNSGAVLSGTVTVQAEVTGGNPLIFIFYLDNRPIKFIRRPPYQFSLDTKRYPNGPHQISARGYFISERGWIYASPVSVTFQNEKPEVKITYPEHGEVVTDPVTITAETSGGEVSQVRFYIDGRRRGIDNTFPYEYLWNPDDYRNGFHLLHARAYFVSLDRWIRSSMVRVRIDHGIPEITQVTPGNETTFTAGQSITVTVQAEDSDGDRLWHRFLVDGEIKQNWQRASIWTWQTGEDDFGLHNITVEVRDRYGGTDSETIELFLFRSMPVLPAR